MKIIFEKNILNNVLTAAMSAVSTKNIIPATSGILVTTQGPDKVTITAYDLEKGITTTVPAEVIEEGEYVINAIRLNQIVKTLSEGDITIEVDEKCMTKITNGRSEFSMPALPGSDFPGTPTVDTGKDITIPQSVMRDMISRTIFAVAQTDQRPIYCGVYFEVKGSKIVAVSCDSFRLAYTEQECEIQKNEEAYADMSFIVPGKTLIEVMKFLSDNEEDVVKVRIGGKHALFEIGEFTFFTRLLEGQYIDYNRYIPKDNTIFVKVNTNDFMDSLERAALISEEKAQVRNFVKCNFNDNVLVITANAVSGNVYDEVAIEKNGSDLEIAFTCRYLLEALKVCNVEKIKLSMSGPLRAMVIEPAEDEESKFLFVTLPTRMK
ncbi:MAG: DNA polymerase III subunit beta [Clostridia bacterium]|nr:DNA polymerase III subunit beta [Clostridia bacterium]